MTAGRAATPSPRVSQQSRFLPGPAFLPSLEWTLSQKAPWVLSTVRENVSQVGERLGFDASDHHALDRGLTAYHMLFVTPMIDLAREQSDLCSSAAVLQLVAITHWRLLDSLVDDDALLVSSDRHRHLAFAAVKHLGHAARARNLDWDGKLGKEHSQFAAGPRLTTPVWNASPAEYLDAFLREVFIEDLQLRASFLWLVPKHILGLDGHRYSLYRYLIALLTLDDDLDDLVNDVQCGRVTPLSRYFSRLGLLGPGQSSSLISHLRVMRAFLSDRLEHGCRLAHEAQATTTALILEAFAEGFRAKWQAA